MSKVDLSGSELTFLETIPTDEESGGVKCFLGCEPGCFSCNDGCRNCTACAACITSCFGCSVCAAIKNWF